METQLKMVAEFYEALGITCRQIMLAEPLHDLMQTAKRLLADARRIESRLASNAEDKRYLRGALSTEEQGEHMYALAVGCDEDAASTEEEKAEARLRYEALVLDTLCDAVYVHLGTALTFDLPIVAAFAEVHRSNMSKRKQSTDLTGDRVKDKGPEFSPPDLVRVIREYRASQKAKETAACDAS